MVGMRWMLLALTLGGCAGAWSEAMPGPNGRAAYLVKCRRSQANCYREAARVCPGGYTLVAKHEDNAPVYLDNGVTVTTPDDLFIECKAALAAR